MLKGDLATTPFAAVITDLATSAAVGCLHVEGPDGDEALVYFKTGVIYSAYLPGRRPQLGARLISSGALAPEALEEALEAQATELQGWRLGELLVHLGFVEAEVVTSFGVEQVRDACFEMSRWDSGKWKFRKSEKTREDIAAPVEVAGILDEILRRELEWAILLDVIRSTESVPILGAGGLASAEMALDQDEWALLCKVDGERNIHQLARDCGFTDFEAGQIVSSLVTAGLLEIDVPAADSDAADADESPLAPRSAAARLIAAFAGGGDDAEATVADDVDLGSDGDDADVAMPSYLNSLVMPLLAESTESADESAVGSELMRLLASRDDSDVIDDVLVEDITATPESDEPEAVPAGYTSYALPPIDPDAFADEPSADPDASLPRYSVGFSGRDNFDKSLSAVSEALSALLGSQPADALSIFNAEYLPSAETDEEERARIMRDAAAAEMSAAHEEMQEQRRRFDEARVRAEEAANEEAAAEQVRRTAERDAEAAEARISAEEAAYIAAEEYHRLATEQEARIEAEEEAARIAAADEAARTAAAFLDLEEAAPPPAPSPTAAPVLTDTASLMRELSSLGFDDEPAPVPIPNRSSTPAGASARSSAAQTDKGKKRKGLFGRG